MTTVTISRKTLEKIVESLEFYLHEAGIENCVDPHYSSEGYAALDAAIIGRCILLETAEQEQLESEKSTQELLDDDMCGSGVVMSDEFFPIKDLSYMTKDDAIQLAKQAGLLLHDEKHGWAFTVQAGIDDRIYKLVQLATNRARNAALEEAAQIIRALKTTKIDTNVETLKSADCCNHKCNQGRDCPVIKQL